MSANNILAHLDDGCRSEVASQSPACDRSVAESWRLEVGMIALICCSLESRLELFIRTFGGLEALLVALTDCVVHSKPSGHFSARSSALEPSQRPYKIQCWQSLCWRHAYWELLLPPLNTNSHLIFAEQCSVGPWLPRALCHQSEKTLKLQKINPKLLWNFRNLHHFRLPYKHGFWTAMLEKQGCRHAQAKEVAVWPSLRHSWKHCRSVK